MKVIKNTNEYYLVTVRDNNYQEELRQTWEKGLSSDPIWIKASKGMNISLHKVPEYINVEIPGEIVFGCDRRVWQAYIFYRYVNNKVKLFAIEQSRNKELIPSKEILPSLNFKPMADAIC